MQTAVGVFGGEAYSDRTDILPLMVANAGNSDRSAISSLDCPPIVAVELCREHLVHSLMQHVWFMLIQYLMILVWDLGTKILILLLLQICRDFFHILMKSERPLVAWSC